MSIAAPSGLVGLQSITRRGCTPVSRGMLEQVALIVANARAQVQDLAGLDALQLARVEASVDRAVARGVRLIHDVYASVFDRGGAMPYREYAVRSIEITKDGGDAIHALRMLRSAANLSYIDSLLNETLQLRSDADARAATLRVFYEFEIAGVDEREVLRCGYFTLVLERAFQLIAVATPQVTVKPLLRMLMCVIDGSDNYSDDRAHRRLRVCDYVTEQYHRVLSGSEWDFVCDALDVDLERT